MTIRSFLRSKSEMIDILKNSFEKNADKVALETGDEQITFGGLWSLAKRYAFSLKDGTNPVVIKGEKQIHMLAGIVACLMVSRAYIPCDESIPPLRLEYLTEISGADTVIDSSFVPPDEELKEFRNDENATAYIIFTSGSTGKPKGVPVSRKNLRAFITKLLLRLPAMHENAGGVVLNQARFSFDLSVADIYYSLCTGSTLFALDADIQRSPDALVDALGKSNATVAVMTPTFAKYCLCMPEFTSELMPRLRSIFFCGEMLEAKTVRKLAGRFSGIRIINAYGPTEATCAVCGIEITPEMCDAGVLPVGKTDLASCGILIDDGEILLNGDSVFGGYLGAEPLTGAYRTGDRGEIKNGLVYCFGRKYGYIKYKGHRIETDEIKNAVLGIDGVEQCEVTAVRNAAGAVTGITAKAVSFSLTEEEIKSELCRTLPSYMIPKSIKILSNITFNDNGKQSL